MFRPATSRLILLPKLSAGPLRTSTRAASTTRLPAQQPSQVWSRLALGAVAASALYLLAPKHLSLDAPPLLDLGKGIGRPITAEELRAHNKLKSAWVVIDGNVFDVTNFLEKHPGGIEVIEEHLGKDISPLFNLLHAPGSLNRVVSELTYIGSLAPNARVEVVGLSDEIDERRENLRSPDTVINLAQFEKLAKEVLGEDSRVWNFFSSFADDGASFHTTKSSWSYLRFLPRVNIPVREVSPETTFLGKKVPLPIMYCPTGQTASGHPDGELNLTRGSAVTGVPHIISTMASVAYPDLAAERDKLAKEGKKSAPLWWQLYIFTDRKESERRMREVVKAGCEAILITVDAPEIGNREADAKPPSSSIMESNLTWDDIAWVKRTVKDINPSIPVLVKGVGTVEDVELAKKYGAAGVVLSNHGGRQLDHAPPPLATLVRLREEKPALLEDSKFDVFIDGGVSRGTDVLKALCLGAKGVGLGRVMLYAQTCYGDAGIVRATEILEREIKSGMRLLGARTIQELRPEMIELMDGLVGKRMGGRPISQSQK